jgi:HK97 family phage portal protein
VQNPFAALFRYKTVGAEDISQTPSQPLIAALGGTLSASGASVTEYTAEGLPALYAAVHLIADNVAQLPLKLMRRREDGGRDVATDHPLYTVLHDLANPELTAFDLRETLQTHLCLWGNAYAEVVRDARGRVTQLWPLDPARMTIDRDGLNRLRYVYELLRGGRQVWIYDPNRPPLLHLRINAHDGIHGRSPIRLHRESLGLTKAAEQFGARFFGNQARPSGVLQAKTQLSPEAQTKLRTQWEAMMQGDRMHSTAILEEGMVWQSITVPPEDAQFLETRKFQIDEIARIYRIPPHMLGAVDRSTSWGTGIEQQQIGFLTFTLMPWLERWKQAIKRDLLNRQEFTIYDAVFIVNGLLKGDAASRAAALATQRQNGIINANEWRALEEMDPIAAEDGGDLYMVNGNMLPMTPAVLTEANAPTAAPAASEDADRGRVM